MGPFFAHSLLAFIINIKIVTCLNRGSSIDFDSSFIGPDFSIIGPRCIPLVSKSPSANPYHPSLVSLQNVNVRRGLGLPFKLPIGPLVCPLDSVLDAQTCDFSISKAIQVTIDDSYSITLDSSKSFTKSLGDSHSKGFTNEYAKSIGNQIDRSLENSNMHVDEKDVADSITKSLGYVHDLTTGVFVANKRRSVVQITSTVDQDLQPNGLISTDIFLASDWRDTEMKVHKRGHMQNTGGFRHSLERRSVLDLFGQLLDGLAPSASNPAFPKYDTTGKEKPKTLALPLGTSNFSLTNIDSTDSISVSRDSSHSKTVVFSDATGTSSVNTNSYIVDDAFRYSNDTTYANDLTLSDTDGSTRTNDNTKSVSYQTTDLQIYDFTVSRGACKLAVCLHFVVAVAVPFDCIANDSTHDIIHVDYIFIDRVDNKTIQCVHTLINCNERNNLNLFIIDNLEFRNSTRNNSIEYGDTESFDLVSKNERFTLKLNSDGNLVVKRHDVVIWENGMGFFDESYEIRIRINEKGHLVEEVKGLFNNTVPLYRPDEWILVWSSVSLQNKNFTIGIATQTALSDRSDGYKLVIENTGELNLYDSVGANIWCATRKDCRNRFGFKFPEVYLVPTNMITPQGSDAHGSIDPRVRLLNQSELVSMDMNCAFLNANMGLTSTNQRFKLILEETGNLIVKDGFRTMWESTSGNVSYARRPYQLILSPVGNLMVLDVDRLIVWTTKSNKIQDKPIRPFKLQVLDEGRIVVTDGNNSEIWESWPIRNMSSSVKFQTKIKYRFEQCHGKKAWRKSILKSDGDNKIIGNDMLVSENQIWELAIQNSSIVIRTDSSIKSTLYENHMKNRSLYVILSKKGQLIVKDLNRNGRELFVIDDRSFPTTNGPFQALLNNEGKLKVMNLANHTIWHQ